MDAHVTKKGGRPRWLGWLALLGALASAAAHARAHDLWLEPNAPLAAHGDELTLHLREGDAFKSDEERPLQKDHVERFDLFSDRARRRDLLAAGKEEQTPVAHARLESGAGLVVMDRGPRPITMPPDKFNHYLISEGLDAVTASRGRLGQSDQPGVEVYSRYLKTLIQERDLNAATPSTLYKRRVGQRLEILLETDPGRMQPDGSLVVKVIFDDKPLAGARVFAYRRTGNDAPLAATTASTSARGLAEFKVDQPGLWLVRLVYMRAATDKRTDAPAQWESFWAAYTFAVRIAPSVAPIPSPKDG